MRQPLPIGQTLMWRIPLRHHIMIGQKHPVEGACGGDQFGTRSGENQLFDQYHFLNISGVSKSLIAIFQEYAQRNPAGGAGECAAPKLLHYAFENKMKPIAIAEFWWGKSTIYKDKVHGEFYPACEDKCKPILSYMLKTNF